MIHIHYQQLKHIFFDYLSYEVILYSWNGTKDNNSICTSSSFLKNIKFPHVINISGRGKVFLQIY
jgi:hypothetical protein